jgi:hypothetical protein
LVLAGGSAGREDALEQCDLVRSQPERDGSRVLLDPSRPGRAWDRHDVLSFVEEPGERDLSRRRFVLGRDLGEPVDEQQVSPQVRRGEGAQVAPKVALVQCR